jgi:parvulin-like peptidyl-prolyl isomerase
LRGSLVKNFETVAFTLSVNQISEPIETQFGLHLIETLEKKGDKIRVRHILIIPPKTQDDTKRTFDFMTKIKEDSIKSLQDFKLLVNKYSEDESTKKVGGSLGWIDPLNYSVEEIGKSIKYIDKGVCSPPINSNLGIHLIWIENVKEGGALNLKLILQF